MPVVTQILVQRESKNYTNEVLSQLEPTFENLLLSGEVTKTRACMGLLHFLPHSQRRSQEFDLGGYKWVKETKQPHKTI